MTALDNIIKFFSSLPGIGKKSATRIAYHLLKKDKSFLEDFGSKLKDLKEKIKECSFCGHYSDTDPCQICSNPGRDKETICIVEHPMDIFTIESTGEYKGIFFVLGGLISPIDGIGPNDIKLDKLKKKIVDEKIKEVIIATNPTAEGDTTAFYILKLLKDIDLKITRLASGIPVGGDLEYAGKLTLARSIKSRVPFTI